MSETANQKYKDNFKLCFVTILRAFVTIVTYDKSVYFFMYLYFFVHKRFSIQIVMTEMGRIIFRITIDYGRMCLNIDLYTFFK